MANVKLELVNLRKEFGDLIAVNDVSIAIAESETMALLGPSGCGKSTILNMIVGLEEPTSGDILIDGKSVLKVPPGDRNVGLVFQDYAVFTHMTVRRNLAYGLKIRKMKQTDIDREIAKVAEFLSITHQLDKKPGELGASELQRVAIGRTLVTNPEILLLDEPLSNLEAAMRNQMRRELRRIQAETGQTIIYVTHDQIEALSLSDAENRIGVSMLNLAEDMGIIRKGKVTIEKLPFQQDIANMSGTSRETVSRVLKLFEDRHMITKVGHTVFTLILFLAKSMAIPFVNPSSPALVILYTLLIGPPTCAI